MLSTVYSVNYSCFYYKNWIVCSKKGTKKGTNSSKKRTNNQENQFDWILHPCQKSCHVKLAENKNQATGYYQSCDCGKDCNKKRVYSVGIHFHSSVLKIIPPLRQFPASDSS